MSDSQPRTVGPKVVSHPNLSQEYAQGRFMDAKSPFEEILSLQSNSGISSIDTLEFAQYADKSKPSMTRDLFEIPRCGFISGRYPDLLYRRAHEGANYKPEPVFGIDGKPMESNDDEPCVYMAGNSLGLAPRSTKRDLMAELDAWANYGVKGHTHARFPWVSIDEMVTPTLGKLVGAKMTDSGHGRMITSEVACMGSLTANLNTLFTAFYKPTPQRHKIMFEAKCFPSDQYAFASQVSLKDYSPDSLLQIRPREGEYTLRTEDILQLIEEQGSSVAIICLGAVQYYTGQWFDMKTITKAGHAKGCLVAWDLAHAIGNVPLQLHDWGVDFAMWCSYKYLNSGPGSIAGIFVHERHKDHKRLQGWWGHDKESRFSMPPDFIPLPGARGFQVSNPPVMDIIALNSSLQIFNQMSKTPGKRQSSQTDADMTIPFLAGLRYRSTWLTSYLEGIIKMSKHYRPLAEIHSAPTDDNQAWVTIITPENSDDRGSQLSILFNPPEAMEVVFAHMESRGVIGDERKPAVMRLAPIALYSTFQDCYRAYSILQEALHNYKTLKATHSFNLQRMQYQLNQAKGHYQSGVHNMHPEGMEETSSLT